MKSVDASEILLHFLVADLTQEVNVVVGDEQTALLAQRHLQTVGATDSRDNFARFPDSEARVPEARVDRHRVHELSILQSATLHMEHKWFKLQHSISTGPAQR